MGYPGHDFRKLPSFLSLSLLLGCTPDPPLEVKDIGAPAQDHLGYEIVAAGKLFNAGTRVLLWYDSGGYNAYLRHRHFKPEKAGPKQHPERIVRYGEVRGSPEDEIIKRVLEQGWRLEDLQEVVSQVVIHYDACGISKLCFQVLHDERGLSCHFLLDLDGTIYQTLDLQERAWHASQANNISVGIEIAHVGAYSDIKVFSHWYTTDQKGTRIVIPKELGDGGLPSKFVGRPSRDQLFRGKINGRELVQYDFTKEQYRALEKLLLALCRIFPNIKARAPRDKEGRVLDRVFASDEELFKFQGLIGHCHVTTRKVDPGPAFDWNRILNALRKEGIPEK